MADTENGAPPVPGSMAEFAPLLEVPALHRDLTPAMDRARCVCGVLFPRHFDGWDGNRLDCAEAVRRYGARL